MMETRNRRACRRALGLIDWRIRPGGALVAAAGAVGRSSRDQRPPASAGASQSQVAAPAPPATAAADHAPGPENAPSPSAPNGPDLLSPAAAPASGDDEIDSRGASLDGDEPMDTDDIDGLEPSSDSFRAGPCADMDWAALEAYLGECDHRGATRPVFGVGARDAAVLIVGEAPGAQEDTQGVPFVGRAGQLLDRMLFAIGCSRESNVYITNICKFRPPDNRDPTAAEVAADWPVLERQIELMNPKLVVAVGRVAAQTLLDSKQNLGAMRGRLHRYPQRELDVLVTYHPAYLLRSPQQKAKAWDDLKQIAAQIENSPGNVL